VPLPNLYPIWTPNRGLQQNDSIVELRVSTGATVGVNGFSLVRVTTQVVRRRSNRPTKEVSRFEFLGLRRISSAASTFLDWMAGIIQPVI
jgi:hypothetical protein